ncbi:hypothetical protein [Klebsiella aerogenes]|uniref:hypothetical protein n=1 Tax=Klebsiella aerogenes TaxID=548 RepID=UPI0039C1B8E7
MSFYIRKVNTSKWEDALPQSNDFLDMSVDGITNCCKTSDNALSVWKTESQDIYSDENKRLITAMAMALDRPSAMTIIFFSDDDISSLGLDLKETRGQTPYDELADCHRDISNLTLKKIGSLAWKIHEKVNDDDEIKIVSEEEVIGFVRYLFPVVGELPNEKQHQKKWKALYS